MVTASGRTGTELLRFHLAPSCDTCGISKTRSNAIDCNIFNAQTMQTCSTMRSLSAAQLVATRGRLHAWIPIRQICNLQRNFTMRLLSATHFGQLNRPFFTHRHFCTQTLLHTDTFTHRHFYTQKLLYTEAFTHRRFYTQKLLHRNFYTETHLHTEAFTHRHSYTHRLLHEDAFTHRHFYTQRLLHTEAFTHRGFYTQKLLHTGAFTHRRFYTQTLLHTDDFTHRWFYTQNHYPLGAPDPPRGVKNVTYIITFLYPP